MTVQILSKLTKNAWFAVVAASLIVLLAFVTFVLAEPQISYSQDATRDFTITQTITGESTFLVDPPNVTMSGAINGITGGNATGTSQFVVQSNNSSGYYVTIVFDYTHGGTYAMYGDAGGEGILDYGIGNGEPDFGYTEEAGASFAYTIAASSSGDIDDSFEHNNTDTCGGGGGFTTPDLCWATPSSTEFRIIDTLGASDRATSTLKFKVNVPNNPTPVVSAETYTATATLSLYTKP